MSQQKPLDPYKVVCVVKNKDGKEVGRVAAAAKNAASYLETLARQHGNITVDYVEDETYAMVDQMVRGTNYLK